jgi:tetratricopeptide (TPR) repeat protein
MSVSNVPAFLRILSNPIRFKIVRILSVKSTSYSELMKSCSLDLLTQTGVFNYHINRMINIGIIRKKAGQYTLTHLGMKISNLLFSLEKIYPKVFQNIRYEGDKIEKMSQFGIEKKQSSKEYINLTMSSSGLSYIQSDLDPDFVKSIVFLSKNRQVVDIVPIYIIKINPEVLTSIKDVEKFIEENEDYVGAKISVVIDMVGANITRTMMLGKAEELYEQKNYEKAIETYQEVYKKYPQWNYAEDALMMIGLCYGKLEQNDKAIEYLEKGVREYPDLKGFIESTYFYLGVAYAKANQNDKALKSFKKSIKLSKGVRKPNEFPSKEAKEWIKKLSKYSK